MKITVITGSPRKNGNSFAMTKGLYRRGGAPRTYGKAL